LSFNKKKSARKSHIDGLEQEKKPEDNIRLSLNKKEKESNIWLSSNKKKEKIRWLS
jgi:hypothetical protein